MKNIRKGFDSNFQPFFKNHNRSQVEYEWHTPSSICNCEIYTFNLKLEENKNYTCSRLNHLKPKIAKTNT